MTVPGRLAALVSGLAISLAPVALGDQPAKAVAPTAEARAGVDLSPKFAKGDVSNYDFVFTSSRTNTVGDGAPNSQVFTQSGRVVRRVLRADDEGFTISLTYERVSVEISGGPMALKFDSASPPADDPDNPFVKSLRLAVGMPMTIRLDRDGQIRSIEGNTVAAADPSSPNAQAIQPAPTLMSDTIIRRTLAPLFALPGGPKLVAPGGSWQSSLDTPQPPVGIFTADKTYTLGAVDAGVASITIAGTVKLSPATGSSAVEVKLNEHEIAGQIRWDASRGLLREYSDRQSVKLAGPDNSGVMRTLDSQVGTKFTLTEPSQEAKPAATAK